jgi:predicted DNA-binding antitoxin AbrB/MazE fold protein
MPVEAIYEQGTLRLSQPIKLAEGSKVQVIIIPLESNYQQKKTLEILQEIAELPLECDRFSNMIKQYYVDQQLQYPKNA